MPSKPKTVNPDSHLVALSAEERRVRRNARDRGYYHQQTPAQRARRRASWRAYETRRPKRKKLARTPEQKGRRLAYNRQHAEWVSFKNALCVAGITLDQYHAKYENQDFLCAICHDDMSQPKQRHIDHSHLTGHFRGILCHRCNHGLGKFNDDSKCLRRAAQYLERAGP